MERVLSGPGFEFLGAEEEQYVLDALHSGTLTRYRFEARGDTSYVYRFERLAESVLGTPHAIAVNSGTSALLTALVAVGIGPGDEVIVPGYTFIASLASVVYAGAVPVLAEVNDTLGLDPADVESRITPRTKAIMPVHMLGGQSDMAALTAVASRHGVLLVEDVAQAFGGAIGGRHLGTFGAAGAFSLNHFKVISSGEGGLSVLRGDEQYERGYAFHDHGFRPFRDGAVEADALFGLNLRMADLVGAVALAQLERLDIVLSRTRAVKAEFTRLVGQPPGLRLRRTPDPAGECATTAVYLFDDPADARKTAQLVGAKTLIDSGRHYYGNMPQLRTMDDASPSCAFQPWRGPDTSAYRAGALPRTDDILARAVAVSTGASDWYAGTGFGPTAKSTGAQIAAAAEAFTDAVRKVVG
jgi:dTDP-4-amino-4,6-dideoxygalactose transaminase